jgi:fibrillarin-like rRNA methylase
MDNLTMWIEKRISYYKQRYRRWQSPESKKLAAVIITRYMYILKKGDINARMIKEMLEELDEF